MVAIFRILAALAMLYNAWIIFRVVEDWAGLVVAVVAMVLLPLSNIVVLILMLFIPSLAAGPLALWPALLFVGFLAWIAKKQNSSLLIQ